MPPKSKPTGSYELMPASPTHVQLFQATKHQSRPVVRRCPVESQRWHPLEQRPEQQFELEPRELRAETEMRARTESEMPVRRAAHVEVVGPVEDRKSTRLNSSHLGISYAVFCLKK